MRHLRICALGCGTMGAPTAAVFALGGCDVFLAARNRIRAEQGKSLAIEALDVLERRGIEEKPALTAAKLRLHPCEGLEEAAREADVVMESVPEDIAFKKEMYARVERVVRDGVPILSNTSGLMPSLLSGGMAHPERFVVTHFWNPPHLIPLVEVVPGPKTAPKVTARVTELLRSLGKKPVVLRKEAAGFIGNRLQFALLREAFHIVESGVASKEDVDEAVRNSLGRRLRNTWPFETADLGGLDVFLSISRYLFPDLSGSVTPPRELSDAVARGDLGAKTGSGLGDWTAEKIAFVKKARETTLVRCLLEDRDTHTPSES